MTTPVAHDHPDWMRTLANTDIGVFNNQVSVGVAGVNHGRFLVGTSPYIQLTYSVQAGGARLTLDWYNAKTGSALIGTNTVDILAGGVANGSFPCLGPYVELSSVADANNRTVNLQAWQSSVAGWGAPMNTPGQLIVADAVAVPTATTTDFNAADVMWGWGFWHSHFEGGSVFRHRLYAVSYQSVATLLDFVPASMNIAGNNLMIPPRPMRIQVLQNDGVNRELFATLTVHPGPL